MSQESKPSDKKFGLFFSLIFLMAFTFVTLNYKEYLFLSSVLFLSSFIIFLLSILKPNSLSFLNMLWMNLGLILGKIIGPIILGFIFYILISPISIITRFFGRDELRINVTKSSYWIDRSEKHIYFKNQF